MSWKKKTKTFEETENKHLLTLDSASESVTAIFSSSGLYSQEKKMELWDTRPFLG